MGEFVETSALRRLETSAVERIPASVAAFLIATAGFLAIALIEGSQPFWFDSGMYWELGGSFTRGGGFSLLDFDSPLRGYLLPLVAHGLDGIAAVAGSPSLLVRLFNSLLFAGIATVLAPALALTTWPQTSWGIGRRLAVAVLLGIFWHGYLSYPLSDFPALACVLLALIAVARVDSTGWMLVAGLALSAAIDLRPSYLLLVPVAAVLVGVAWRRQQGDVSWRRRGLAIAALLAGFVAIALPQSLATHRHHGTWSFVPGAAAGLSRLQFTEGLRMQRYESYVGGDRGGARMVYGDPAGAKLLARQPGGTVDSAGDYARLVLSHPLTMAGVFGRHVVNGLDQRYTTPYVERLDTGGSRWLRAAGFLLCFAALARLAWPAARRALGQARWEYPAALLLSGATAIASAVETRFMLPVVVLIYLLVVAAPWPNPLAAPANGRSRLLTPTLLLGAAALLLLVAALVTNGASDQLALQ